jgi:hypothetical protein
MFKIEIMTLARSHTLHTEYRVEILCPERSPDRVLNCCAIQVQVNRVQANRELVAMLVAAANEAERVFELTGEESAKLTSEMLQFITLRIPPICAGYGVDE